MLAFRSNRLIAVAAIVASITPSGAMAQVRSRSADQATFVDTVELSKKSAMVVLARVTHLEPVAVSAPGSLSSTHRRYYAEASTRALLYGQNGIGGSLRYLVDLPAGPASGAPDLEERRFSFLQLPFQAIPRRSDWSNPPRSSSGPPIGRTDCVPYFTPWYRLDRPLR